MPNGSRVLLFVALALCLAREVAAIDVIHLGQVEALGTFTDIHESEHDYGTDGSLFYSPVMKVSDTFTLIPLVDVHFNAYPQYLPQDEGQSFYNTYLITNLHVAARKEFRPGWFVKLTPLATWSYMKETSGDDWGDGLYDYTDFGVNGEIRHIVRDEGTEAHYVASVEYYKRKYPNFVTLVSSTTVTPPETHEKDYHGIRYLTRTQHQHAGGDWYIEPSLLQKLYADKHTVNDDGTLDLHDDRHDYEFGLAAGGSYLPRALNRLRLTLDAEYVYNLSNMSYYDTRNTISLSDDVFTNNYYDYQSYLLAPGIEYRHPWGEERAITVRLGYDILYRLYDDRKALTEAGNYTTDDQHDVEHTYSFSLRVPLIRDVDFVTYYAFQRIKSNQEFEDFYRYSVSSHTVKTGISWHF